MKINKNILKKGASFVLVGTMAGTMVATMLSGCNKQVVDLNKSFNVAIEVNNDTVSIVGVNNYGDYEGNQVQIKTEDGLVILTSTHQTNLINVKSEEIAYDIANSLAGSDSKRIIDYNKLQGVKINTFNTIFNKQILDIKFAYNKAIIESDNNVTIFKIKKWKDYDDDKVQLILEDGTAILTSIDKVKIIDDRHAQDDSLKNYALSLVGNEDEITYYDDDMGKIKVK